MPGIMIIDGYNVVHAIPTLSNTLVKLGYNVAREKLIDLMSDYSASSLTEVIIVFDAHMVINSSKKIEKFANVSVVFTQSGETADHYIEKLLFNSDAIANEITVVTADATEQWMVFGKGASRMTPYELLANLNSEKRITNNILENLNINSNKLMDRLDAKTRSKLEAIRKGEI